VTFSLPIKIAALAGLVCALALAGFLTLAAAHHRAATETVVPVAHHPAAPASKPALRLDPALPAPLYRALESSREVVAVLYAPHVAADASVVAAARAGARQARVGFVALDVTRNAVAARLAAWLPGASDPAVVVVRRPGTVAVELDGWADDTMVAQAAANARG
jgi:hypothetical protein